MIRDTARFWLTRTGPGETIDLATDARDGFCGSTTSSTDSPTAGRLPSAADSVTFVVW